jgi:predicted ATP-dependent endonuclease of OLD family
MIEAIRLRNFQCHDRLEIRLDQITTIVGSSDVGKSAIVRALGLALFNRPSGDAFIKHGTEFTSVQVKVDGRVVTRKKGKRNLYKLDDKEFVAFGAGAVPEEIANLLNVNPVNFQEQLDPHFWLTDTPGQVSRNLNQIVNLESIDQTLAAIASELRKGRAVVEVTQSRLAEAKARRKSLKWVKEFDAELTELEGLERTADDKRRKSTALGSVMDGIQRAALTNERLRQATTEGQEIVKQGQEAIDKGKAAESLSDLVDRLNKAREVAEGPVPNLTKLEAIRADADEVAERRRNLEMVLTEMKEQEH